ncbi:MAG: 4Fe-4S binding protein [Chloroflexi bacterium]|nr:4Fe-4S binding protein [Chloroflexota bacterium]
MTHSVVSTNVARCRDCYRCVRTCPVKAVRVQSGQAQVVAELCIVCGSCVRACPQGAKSVRDDRPAVREALAAGRTLVASVAPSAPAYFGIQSFAQMEQALRALGFSAAHETAFGAEMVGHAHREVMEAEPSRWPVITSSCPVVVNLIEIYYPDLIPHLAPVVSPMIAHGRWLRQRYGEEAFLVFIGPCFAKKGEIREEAVEGVIDAALTYEELSEWLQSDAVAMPAPPDLHEHVPRANARVFPVEGGLVGTANLDTDILASEIVTTSGLSACEDVLQSIRAGTLRASLVELMACEGGCINGPGMGKDIGVYQARQRVLEYAARRQPQPLPSRSEWPPLTRTYRDKSVPLPDFTEEQIREVLHRVDKYTPEDELNCGACGYPTCRDKAIATLRGLAEATMCIPYTRKRAESLRQVIMAVTQDPVITVDTRLHIQDMSPSAEAMLRCSLPQVMGHPLDEVAPPVVLQGFESVRRTGQPIIRQRLALNGLIVEQTIVAVKDQNLIVGILRDVTEHEQQRAQLERIREETLQRTQEVVIKQMRVAHEIAQLLGETTADAKIMLSRLAKLLEEESEP